MNLIQEIERFKDDQRAINASLIIMNRYISSLQKIFESYPSRISELFSTIENLEKENKISKKEYVDSFGNKDEACIGTLQFCRETNFEVCAQGSIARIALEDEEFKNFCAKKVEGQYRIQKERALYYLANKSKNYRIRAKAVRFLNKRKKEQECQNTLPNQPSSLC